MAKDYYHNTVKEAPIKDGWEITHDPYEISTPEFDLEVDIGAEKLLGAKKENKQIAAEIKGFHEESKIYAFHKALGQYLDYKIGLKNQEPNRQLYLAVPADIFESVFQYSLFREVLKTYELNVVVFDPINKKILSWVQN